MTANHSSPFLSIILSTRDRPELFAKALDSVAQQSFLDKEIIVVVDGSNDSNMIQYQEMVSRNPDVQFHFLKHRSNGHGQSYTMNYGAMVSRGRFLCFLDDDDYWTDKNYLQTVYDNLSAAKMDADVHYSNQTARYSDGKLQEANVWLDDLVPRVGSMQRNTDCSYFTTIDFLLSSGGFAHLNCSVFKREFYDAIGGMDESIRYENDRDVYIRSIDAADKILFCTQFVSMHNIPDMSKKNNMSTISSHIDKKMYQLRVYDKGVSLAKNPAIAKFCAKGKIFELKHTAHILDEQKNYWSAAFFAKQALVGGFNLRWAGYTLYLTAKSLLQKDANKKTDTAK